MSKLAEIERLEVALEEAIRIIRRYEVAIKSQGLDRLGFCQEPMYREAVERLKAVLLEQLHARIERATPRHGGAAGGGATVSYYVISGEPCPACSMMQEVWRDRQSVTEEVWGLDCPACRGTGRVLVSLAEALIALTAAPEPQEEPPQGFWKKVDTGGAVPV